MCTSGMFSRPRACETPCRLPGSGPMPGKQRSRRQFRDAGIERPIAGVVDEIAGFDGVEFHPAPLADQKVLLKARHQVGNESSQGVALRILAGLVVVDTSPHTNSGRRLRDGAPQMQSVAPQRAVQVCSGNIRENVRARYAFAPWRVRNSLPPSRLRPQCRARSVPVRSFVIRE